MRSEKILPDQLPPYSFRPTVPMRSQDRLARLKHWVRMVFCEDEHNRVLLFTIPRRHLYDRPVASSSLTRLPMELVEQILLCLHPVDRICLALASKELLQRSFTKNLIAPLTYGWSHIETDRFVQGAKQYVFCYESWWFTPHLSHDVPDHRQRRSLLRQLVSGWAHMNHHWAYCMHCERLRSLDYGDWVDSSVKGMSIFRLGSDPKKLRYDPRLLPDISRFAWSKSPRTRPTQIVQQWQRQVPVMVNDANYTRGPNAQDENHWQPVCPTCVAGELSRCYRDGPSHFGQLRAREQCDVRHDMIEMAMGIICLPIIVPREIAYYASIYARAGFKYCHRKGQKLVKDQILHVNWPRHPRLN